jgi:hypothetical protein
MAHMGIVGATGPLPTSQKVHFQPQNLAKLLMPQSIPATTVRSVESKRWKRWRHKSTNSRHPLPTFRENPVLQEWPQATPNMQTRACWAAGARGHGTCYTEDRPQFFRVSGMGNPFMLQWLASLHRAAQVVQHHLHLPLLRTLIER